MELSAEELIQFIMLGGLLVERGAAMYRSRKNGKGEAQSSTGNGTLRRHAERIKANETDIRNLKEATKLARDENREDHGKIFEILNQIRVAIAKLVPGP